MCVCACVCMCWVRVHVCYMRVRARAHLCVQINVCVYMRALTAHHQEEACEPQESSPLASPADASANAESGKYHGADGQRANKRGKSAGG